MIRVSIFSGSSSVVKATIGDAIIMMYISGRVDVDWLIALAKRRLILVNYFYGSV